MHRRLASAFLLLLVVACTSPGSAQAPTAFRLGATPVMTAQGEHLFRISDAAAAKTGDIVAVSGGTYSIVIMDPRGRVKRTIGRQGDGPGEYQLVSRIALFGDTIVSWDLGPRRATRWLMDGKLIDARVTGSNQIFAGALNSGTFIQTERINYTGAPGFHDDSMAVNVFDAKAGSSKQIAKARAGSSSTVVIGNGSTSYSGAFFGAGQVRALRNGAAISSGSRPELDIVSSTGTRVRTVKLPIASRQFRKDPVATTLDSLVKSAPQYADRITAGYKGFPRVTRMPFTRGMIVDGNGNPWIEEYPEPGSTSATWFVVEPATGRITRSVKIPSQMKLLWASTARALVTYKDSDDVEILALFDLVVNG